tara:strand:+ start:221 stop:562 length:342 start_codon:yes stop_codon:yes gene_type:complete
MSFIGEDWVQWVGIIYLPLAVTALADSVSEFSRIGVRKHIRSTDYVAKVDQLLLDEAKGNPNETLTEAEFLISVLKSHDIVDDAQSGYSLPSSPGPPAPTRTAAQHRQASTSA